MADESRDPSDSSKPNLTSRPGDSEGEKGTSHEPTQDVTPDKELPTTLPPAVCRTLEDGPPGQDHIGEGVGMGADPTTRVLGLLGMGHRLFVPRLLAVRGGRGSQREGGRERHIRSIFLRSNEESLLRCLSWCWSVRYERQLES